MARFWLIAAVAAVAFLVYSLVDCAMSDPARIRGPRKGVWLLIILLPVLGGVLWFTVGRGRTSGGPARRMTAPDDDPAFLRRIAEEAAERERIRRLEERLAELDPDRPRTADGDSDPGDTTDRRDA